LADVLQKTGIVERSGQGVDKIFYNTLSEGKAEPDYNDSDYFQVNLKLSAVIRDRAFALFIDSVQKDLPDNKKLSVLEIITLDKIKRNISSKFNKEIINKLLSKKLIEKRGKTNAIHYVLSKDYYDFTDEKAEYYKNLELGDNQVLNTIIQFLTIEEKAKMKDLVSLFNDRLSRRQIRTRIDKFIESEMLEKLGKGKLATYSIGQNFIKQMSVYTEAVEIGMKEMKKKEKSD
jgi:ATP-dependent DNA helicase RecG